MSRFAAIAVLSFWLALPAFATCLAYGPAVVISGKLEQRTFPGRPNFADTAKGDEKESGFYLLLAEPVCTTGESSSGISYPQNDVTTVQLILDQSGYERLRPLLGKVVGLKGSLVAAHTGHHHAPLLLDNVALAASER